MSESNWDMPIPRENDVVELHCGETQRWQVQEVEWVFEDAPASKHEEVAVRVLKVLVVPESMTLGGEEHHHVDPLCLCGHKKSMHAASRCLGDAGTCQCHAFTSTV